MWRKALVCAGGAVHRRMLPPWRTIASRSSLTASYTVNSMILRSLKDHYLEVSKMTPPPKISPPSPYVVVKGALDSGGPVLKRTFQDEEINVSVMRMVDIIPGGSGDDYGNDSINQLFVHVDISKPGQQESLHFLCGLYPDALGIHSVSLRPKAESSGFLVVPTKYNGPVFESSTVQNGKMLDDRVALAENQIKKNPILAAMERSHLHHHHLASDCPPVDVDEKVRDALHGYIEERGINESLFPFLQAWLYVKDHRNLMRWFKTVGSFVNESNQGTLQA